MIYLYSRKNHPGLDLLTSALNANRLYRFDGDSFWTKDRKQRLNLPNGSVIIPWGESLPELEDMKVLNGREKEFSRTSQYEILTSGGVKSIRTYPVEANPPQFWLSNPQYIARKFGEKLQSDHSRIINPDYYTDKYDFANEYVIHSFGSRSIRAGELKSQGMNAHPWIRNSANGWSTDTTFTSTPELRAIAHKAVKTLGLTFGMVKIGQTTTGGLMVINVCNAPDLRGLNAIKAYTKSITKWIGTAQPIGGL